ncbi:MAG: CDP-diacylglycerol--serine O-phosphatidyltransferase [Flavobacteriales bacterium]|nr:CDP-diacylglycerol--serine O-phosphatidyltransferase [Flavobacteriales bacterium]
MAFKSHLPNILTSMNLVCGCLAVICALKSDVYPMVWATYLIWVSAIFDFLDGMAARVLKSYSELGKQLDSLADMVSFGVAPGMILYAMIQDEAARSQEWIAYFALIIPVLSALRLAKFNIDEEQSESFIGLPTPANALLIGSLPLLLEKGNIKIAALVGTPEVLAAIGVFLSLLLVSKIGMFSLKVKSYGWNGNELVYSFLALAALILIVLPYSALPIIILLYISISIVQSLLFKLKKS